MSPLACPVCQQPLVWPPGGPVRCNANHSFDVARAGYVHLAPAGHGRSNISGDTKPMAAARRDFLADGWYQPLADYLASTVYELGPQVVFESGCGTGYYLGAVASGLPGAACYGADVSTAALRIAARAQRAGKFFVNDITQQITLQTASVDALLTVFAPRNAAEFARVVKPGGHAIVVVPHVDHLAELRRYGPLLQVGVEKVQEVTAQLAPNFTAIQHTPVNFTVLLPQSALLQLVRMTPTAHHGADFAFPAELAVRVAVHVLVFERG